MKNLGLPLMIVALAVVACGKKDNDAPAVVSSPAPITVTQTSTFTNTSTSTNTSTGGDLQSFCWMKAGYSNPQETAQMLLGPICATTLSLPINWTQLNLFSASSFNSGIFVQAGNRVTVSASGGTKVYVGGILQAAGSASFVANASGSLVFRKGGSWSDWSVQRVDRQTCYSAPNQLAVCP